MKLAMSLLDLIRSLDCTLSVNQLGVVTGESPNTLRGWIKTRPQMLKVLIIGAREVSRAEKKQ